jgi:uncharacterized protein HemY
MHDQDATKCIAACTGLSGFVVAMVANMAVSNPIETAVPRAILAMVVCSAVGYVIGRISTVVINETIFKRAEQAKEASRQAAERALAEVAQGAKQVQEEPASG